jgi:Ca-activated chloride channel homolog
VNKVLCAAVLLMAVAAQAAAQEVAVPARPEHTTPAPVVRITSPIGRTGDSATVRIVAQVQRPPELASGTLRVKFFVDGAQVGIADSPPYAVTWADENPFEPREIRVEAENETGRIGRDTVTLPAFEIEEHTEVGRILVEAGVYDSTGQPAFGLGATDFRLREDGELQTLDVVARETYAMNVVLLVDNSQSMARRMPEVRAAAERFAKSLDRRDTVIVAPFNTKLGSITGPTKDVATVAEAIDAMTAKGGTAILNSVTGAVRLLEGAEGRRIIVLVTDGFDENSTENLESVVKIAQAARVTVYGVAIGGITGVSLTGESTLRQLTTRTSGRVFFPWRETELPRIAKDVAEDARNRYLITYTPSNQKKDGTWRTISLEVPEGHKAMAREGYRAPVPPPVRPTLEFHVTNAANGYVALASTDFELFEDGVLQNVDTFHEALDPVSIVLTLDASGSMAKSADSVRDTAREFVRAVRKEDRLALITFADAPRIEHVLSTDRSLTMTGIDKYTPLGGTALYDGLWDSLLHLKKENGRRAVVLFTDGRDENNPGTAPGSAHTFDEVLQFAREVGATIFTVGLGPRIDRGVLQKLADNSGGQAYFSEGVAELSAQFGHIVENLRQRYVISYSSTNFDRNGEWRVIRIRPLDPSLIVNSVEGYFAPAK